MFEKLRVIFTIPELRQKILLTLLFLAIYRIGWQIPLPLIDKSQVNSQQEDAGNFANFIDRVSVFSASQLRTATIFGLGIMPYISASIIFQLLGSVWKPIEELRKEGETGRKKINEYTRYLTVALCLIQSWIYMQWLSSQPGMIDEAFLVSSATSDPSLPLWWFIVAVLTMTCGTIFLMWLGEQIDEYGIGNGISLLIMAGILARMPDALLGLIRDSSDGFARMPELSGLGNETGIETLIVLAFLFVAVIFGVVFITLGQRRIPTQSAKHVRGRRVYGGARQYLPLRINQAGVMPIIFASSLLMLPPMLFGQLRNISWYESANEAYSEQWSWWAAIWGESWLLGWNTWMTRLTNVFSGGSSFIYNIAYVILIYFFCYFWTAITFNPKEMSENLKESGTFIPGYRPGKRTADYLEKVMVRITYVGAGFLALVAIVPTMISTSLGVDYGVASFYGGTGLLIAVSVAFDLVQKIDSHLVMRNYSGLLET